MISSSIKPAVTKVINPVAKLALRIGLTPNAVTAAGAAGSLASALYFLPQGRLFGGVIAISLFTLSDLFDGAMARISEKGASKWGAFLDSTLDRVVDASILLGVTLFLIDKNDRLAPAVLLALVTGFLISYIRAKAEALSIECTIGIAERTERLVILLTAIGLEGLGLRYSLAVGIWALVMLGSITVIQRLLVVKRAVK